VRSFVCRDDAIVCGAGLSAANKLAHFALRVSTTAAAVLPLLLVAEPAYAQYGRVRIQASGATSFYIIRQDLFDQLSDTDRRRFEKLITGVKFGPHPPGGRIALKGNYNYYVYPVCPSGSGPDLRYIVNRTDERVNARCR
jgi:hypothetical protein